MKIKIALNVLALVITFTFAVNFTASFKLKKNDPVAQEKICNFLLKEQQLNLTMIEKSREVESEKLLEVWKQAKEEKFKLDTADLPEDFRNAWEKRISSDIEWINFFSYFRMSNPQMVLKTDAQIEIFEQKEAEYRQASREFDLLLESYSIEFDETGEPIKK